MTLPHQSIVAGLVVQLDSAALRAAGDCLTNAELGAHGDRAVVGVHDFLVVRVDTTANVCIAVPLFTKTAVGNQPLADARKSGHPDGWIGSDVYFSRWQHWRIPVALIADALAADENAEATRRFYAVGDSSTLDDIRNWDGRNRAPYRPA